MKIGVNKPCPCGSGKKFKKCCKAKQELYEMGFASLESPSHEGLLTGRPFIADQFNGRSFVAVGNVVYAQDNTTFQEFILGHLKQAIGDDWIFKESQLAPEQQHILFKWFDQLATAVTAARMGPKDPQLGVWTIQKTSELKALELLAYDVYSLKHCADILPTLIGRLKSKAPETFGGALYETAVAAIAVRAGFDIKWINIKTKHCEFIGHFKQSGEMVAFEAKNHFRGSGTTRLKTGDHLKEALQQAPSHIPFVVFNNVNLPMRLDLPLPEKPWAREVDGALNIAGFRPKDQVDFSLLLITNFAWHSSPFYGGDTYYPEVMPLLPPNTTRKIKTAEAIPALIKACEQYGVVPLHLDKIGTELAKAS